MKKRILIIVLVIALLLSACGKSANKENNEAKGDNTQAIDENNDDGQDEDSTDDEEEPADEPTDESEEAVPLTLDEYLALREALRRGEDVELPKKLDLRDYGMVTPARNQGNYETCWTFGTTGAIESNAIVSGFGEYNFSEYELGIASETILDNQDEMIAGEGFSCECKWFDFPGEARFVYNTFMKGYVPTNENDYPYRDITKKLPEDAIYNTLFDAHSCYMVSAIDKDLIKKLMIMNGALTIGINALPWLSNYGNNNYEFYDTETTINHFVTLVGWDDTFDYHEFSPDLKKNGAWILKNSWGAGWGYAGHCFVSYYDGALNATNPLISFVLTSKDAYDYQYQYDGGAGLGRIKDLTDVAINFTVKEDQTITGVKVFPVFNMNGFFDATNATIKVYRNVSSIDETGTATPIYTQTTLLDIAGYQTVEFDEGVNINKGDNILITVTFDNPVKYAQDCPTKGKVVDQFEEVRWFNIITFANPGETFYKVKDDSAWKDAAIETENASMCIKVTVRNGHDKEVIHRMSIIR